MSEDPAPRLHRLQRVSARGVRTQASIDAVEEMRAVFCERNRLGARWLRSVHEAALAGREEPLPCADRFSADEIAPALGVSPSMAGRWVELAGDLVGRLPMVLDAMAQGWLEEGKARAISEWTRDLCADHAGRVATLALECAASAPMGLLIERVQELAVALDPDWAARREARARRRARVVGAVGPEGTASLSGYDLPVSEAVEALARVEALAARVARGADRPVGLLRAAVFTRLLRGFGAGLGEDALIDALVEDLVEHPDDEDRDGPDDGPGPDPGPDSGPDSGPGPGPGPDEGPGPQPREEPEDGEGPEEPEEREEPASPRDGAGGGEAGDDTGTRSDPPGSDPVAPLATGPAPPTRGVRRGTVELRVRWSTVLGLDDRSARISGWGTVLAGTARRWVREHPAAEWRLVLTDDAGRLRHVLLTRHRPTRRRPTRRAARGRGPEAAEQRGARGIVELQIPVSELAALRPTEHPRWCAAVAAARARLADLPAEGSPDARPAATDDATRRRARADLDRWVRTRDRHCVAPGCTRAALACDLDHTRAWAEHGPSAAWNLGALCRRHHRMKHRGGWTLTQPRPGRFRWRTRAGHTYDVPARRITDPLPDPEPRRGRRRPLGPDRVVPEPGDGLRPASGPPAGPRPRAPDPRHDPLVLVGADFVPGHTGHPRRGPDPEDEPPPF